MKSFELFDKVFGKTPKIVNGKGRVKMSSVVFEKFKNAWKEDKLPNNQKVGYFYYNNLNILEFWG